ncbi:sulfate reduction electron transfer complex DsrMKJOP subunit DsrO [Pseudomonadota bacterium]
MSEEVGSTNTTRRRFLQKARTATAVAVLAPGFRLVDLALARPEGEPASEAVRWGMLIDTSKCATDCDACVTACNEEHGLTETGRPQSDAQWIRKIDRRDKSTQMVSSLPMMCQHCEDPPCVDVCPTGASFKRADGVVLVDKHTCIGCRYCMMACPYKARSFVHEALKPQVSYSPRGKGTVESCTFCVHRIDNAGTPACVESCGEAGNGAMMFGDLNNSKSEISVRLKKMATGQIRSDLKLNTAVRYSKL